MVRVWKTKSLLFCLRYDPQIIFWRQNHITFIFIKMMSPDFLVQVPYCLKLQLPLWQSYLHLKFESGIVEKIGLCPDPKSPSSDICYRNMKIYMVAFCLFLGVRDSGNQEKRSGYAHYFV